MKIFTTILIISLVLIQYYSLYNKNELIYTKKELKLQKIKNHYIKLKNIKLKIEIQDLKNGTEFIEEYSRYNLGLIKEKEIFIKYIN